MIASDELQRVLVDDLITYQTWEQAPIGGLVQTRIGDASVIGMRCRLYPAGKSPMDRLLLLRGEQRGQLLNMSVDAPALDVSKLFDLVVERPTGKPVTEADGRTPGVVCEIHAGSRELVIRTVLQGQRYFVWLRDVEQFKRGFMTGEDFTDLVAWGMIGLARKPRSARTFSDPSLQRSNAFRSLADGIAAGDLRSTGSELFKIAAPQNEARRGTADNKIGSAETPPPLAALNLQGSRRQ
jgi:hypothetical protein